jgi:hypothetical protein
MLPAPKLTLALNECGIFLCFAHGEKLFVGYREAHVRKWQIFAEKLPQISRTAIPLALKEWRDYGHAKKADEIE